MKAAWLEVRPLVRAYDYRAKLGGLQIREGESCMQILCFID